MHLNALFHYIDENRKSLRIIYIYTCAESMQISIGCRSPSRKRVFALLTSCLWRNCTHSLPSRRVSKPSVDTPTTSWKGTPGFMGTSLELSSLPHSSSSLQLVTTRSFSSWGFNWNRTSSNFPGPVCQFITKL